MHCVSTVVLRLKQVNSKSAIIRSTVFLVFLLILSETTEMQTSVQPSHGRDFDENCNVFSPKAFKTLIRENFTDIVFSFVCKIYLLLVLSKRSILGKDLTRQSVQELRDR